MTHKVMINPNNSYLNKILNLLAWFSYYKGGSRRLDFYYIFCHVFYYVTLTVIGVSFYKFKGDLDKMVILAHHFILVFAVTYSVTYFFKNRKDVKFLLEELHLSYDYESKLMGEFQKTKYDYIGNTIHKFFYRMSYICPIYCFINNNLFSVMEYLFFGGEQLTLFPFPFRNLIENWFTYFLVMLWQEYMMIHVLMILFCALCFLFIFCYHLEAELEILFFALEKTDLRIKERLEKFDLKKIDKKAKKKFKERISLECVNQCVKHHIFVIKYFKVAKERMKLLYGVISLTALVIFVCTGVVTVTENESVKYKVFGLSLIQYMYIYLCCWVGESIANSSENIMFAAYSSKFWILPLSSQKSLSIIMARALKPFVLETILGQSVVAETFMNLVKGSYSYVNMMIQTQD